MLEAQCPQLPARRYLTPPEVNPALCKHWWTSLRPATVTKVDCAVPTTFAEWGAWHAALVDGKLVEDTEASIQHGLLVDTSPAVVAGPIEFTFLAKAGERKWIMLTQAGSGDSWLDLEHGVVGTLGSGVTITLEALGEGWYRVTYRTQVQGGTILRVFISLGDLVEFYDGDGTSGLYLGQIERYVIQQRASAIADQIGTAHLLQANPTSQCFWAQAGGPYASARIAPTMLWNPLDILLYTTAIDADIAAHMSPGGGAWTVAGLMRLTALPSSTLRIWRMGGGTSYPRLGVQTDSCLIAESGVTTVVSPVPLSTTENTVVSWAFDGTDKIEIWQNGVQVVAPTAWTPGGSGATGFLDYYRQRAGTELAMYWGKLSAAEMQQLTQGMLGRARL